MQANMVRFLSTRSGHLGMALTLFGAASTLGAQEIDTVVVTASRTEQLLSNAPSAVTVITAETIEQTPGDDMGDLLRNVPGLNVAQTSVRDINTTARGSTNTLSNEQLVLVDGRSVYLDFFGIVMWDLLPTQTTEIERIEVVRGPGSAIWGANAMSGVINVITARPADIVGTSLTLGTDYASMVHARGNDDFAYKVSASYYDESPFDRPTGTVPGSNPPQTYPPFENEGTTQRRANVRFDWGMQDGYFSLGAGAAATDGIMHTGIGPFDIESGTALNYLQADWYRGDMHIGFSGTLLDGDARNLLTLSADGRPLTFNFVNDTYNIDLSNTSEIGERHNVTYGANLRHHEFDLDLAPQADDKDEWGVFVQDEFVISDSLRWVIGVRYDDVDPLSDAVFTPRTSLIYSLTREHTLRFSYNEAFRTPSAVNNYLGISILQALGPLGVPADAIGNLTLTEEKLEAYEIGYVGFLDNGMSVTASVYRNEKEDSIDFYIADFYGPGNLPAPGPTLPPTVVPCFAVFAPNAPPCPMMGLAGIVPSDYSYRNIGHIVDRGVELSLEQDYDDWYWWTNVSWQDDPEIEGASIEDVNRAPTWRANAGLGSDLGRLFWNASVNYQDESYWADVLYARAATDAFTQVNASVGWRLESENDLTLKLIVQNLFDERLQQHIFGDIIERRVDAQLSLRF